MKFVTDVTRHKWVIFSESRKNYKPPTDKCPFCPQQESDHKELLRYDGVRVIANDFPRVGLDEVIISPDHNKDIDEMPLDKVASLLKVYRDRFNFHKNNGKVFIFQNHDLYAGASIPHPHSQLIVIPFDVPVEPSFREPVANIIFETDYFTVYCPDFSQWPYEVWLAPHDNKTYGEITDKQITDLAQVLQRVLKAMVQKFEINKEMAKKGIGSEFPYNFYIYHGENWYLRIIPRLMRHGGFELSTGLHINTVDPLTAAAEFRNEIAVIKN